MVKQKSRRKNYFIKKKFQANFFLKFTGLLLLEALLIYALFMYVSRGTLTAAYRGADFTIRTTGNYFLVDFIVILVLVGAVIGVLGIFVFMFLSHRIGGALYRFEKTLESAREGDFAQRVKLRKNDELHDLNHRLNLFLETMDQHVIHLKREVDKGLSRVGESKGGVNLDKLKESLENLKESLERFRTSK